MSAFEPRISWVLERAATEFADGEGTVDLAAGERRSWAETSRRVGGVAAGLRDMGLDPGDRVGVLALNSARHFELWFAIPNAALVMTDLNYRLAANELAFICDDSNVKVLFVDDAFLELPRSINLRTHEEPLPKSGAGKILKRDLRAPFWEGHNRSIN